MNVKSLMHNYAKNQYHSSMIDDPFDLKGSFKGVFGLNHQLNLDNYCLELVENYATYSGSEYHISLDKLSDDDQKELIRLYLEATGREVNECIYGNDFSINNEFTCALLAMLKHNCKETRDSFAKVTLNNTLSYFKSSLEELLDNACDIYLQAVINDNDGYASQDLEHGEVVWGRF